MTQILDFLLGQGFIPHGVCLLWRPGILALHAAADAVIAIAYLVIPLAIATFLRRRKDLDRGARQVAWLFAAFIFACGLTHIAGLLTLWVPAYGLQAIIKAGTAIVSLATAIIVWPQIPKLLALPSPLDLRRANDALLAANASLEATIAWRTRELEDSKHRFEQALSRSNIAVVTQDRDLRYTWVHNPRFGLQSEEMVGKGPEGVLPEHGSAEAIELKRRALETGETVNDTIAFATESDGRVYLDMTVSPTTGQDGEIDGVLTTAVDVTEKRLFEVRLAGMAAQLANAYQRFEMALEDSPITVFEQDPQLRYTYMHNPPPGTEIEDYIGRTDFDIMSEADQQQLVPAKRRVFEQKQGEKLEVEMEVAGTRRYYDLTLEPKIASDGTVEGMVGTSVDLTDRRRHEMQMRVVMRELTHRSKNLLAVIQAMARKTASLSGDIDEFVASFSSRLRSIAASHDLLVAHSWSGADLADILRASLVQTVDPTHRQITLEGPSLKVTPDTAQNLGLAFHELTTNATKYGALSTDAGHLTVRWRQEDGVVHIEWIEEGGPEVAPPLRHGFGTILLERLVGASLNGTVLLDYRPDGLRCEIVFSDERLIAA